MLQLLVVYPCKLYIVAQILCMVNKSNPSVQAKSNLFYREDMEREQAKNISSILW